uniref:Putative secreted protein n=1 Tax=Anopheles darlingi TaxID=43151 RepID=A0A2M4D2H4_ANODA
MVCWSFVVPLLQLLLFLPIAVAVNGSASNGSSAHATVASVCQRKCASHCCTAAPLRLNYSSIQIAASHRACAVPRAHLSRCSIS